MGQRRTLVLIDDKDVRRYLKSLERDSTRKMIYARASAKAAIPIRKSARQYLKPSLTHSRGGGRKPLAKFQERVNILNRGRTDKLAPRKKKTINLVRVRRGKRKYRGSAWIVGGPLSNIIHNSKGGNKVKSKNGKPIPIVLKNGTLIFTKFVKRPKPNKFLDKAFRAHKGTAIRIFKAELGIAVRNHAVKNRNLGGKSGNRLRSRMA